MLTFNSFCDKTGGYAFTKNNLPIVKQQLACLGSGTDTRTNSTTMGNFTQSFTGNNSVVTQQTNTESSSRGRWTP